MELTILYEDNYVIAVKKPQAVPVQSDKTKDESLLEMVEKYETKNSSNNKDITIGVVHRLDRPVGGVVIFAKNKFALANLSEQIRDKKIKKEYLCVVCGKPEENEKELNDYLKKLVTINMSKVVDKNDKKAKLSTLKYEVLESVNTEEYGELSLLKVTLYTGRHHQIRVQLSNAGLPIWGDNKYNRVFMKKKEFTLIALWSYEYTFSHPKTKKDITVKSEPTGIYPFSLFNK